MSKIIIVMPDMDLGGITSSVINFCNELVQKGHEVHFLNMDGGSNAPETMSSEIIQHRISGCQRLWNLDWAKLCSSRGIKRLRLIPVAVIKKALNKRKKWLQTVFLNYKLAGTYDIAVAFRQCEPCYYFVLNCVQAKTKTAFIHGNLKSMGSVSSFEYLFSKFDRINCVSKACCRGFQNRYPEIADRFSTVYNMFPVNSIRAMSMETPSISMKKNVFSIVTVSRIEDATKGTNRLLPVSKELRARGYQFAWYVLGDGPDFLKNKREAEESGMTEYLIYCGAVKNPHAVVAKCKLSVLPTRGEAYSMTIIESQILGVPIVVSAYDGVEEAVVNKKSGFIVGQNLDDFVETIVECIHDKDGVLSEAHEYLKTVPFSNDLALQQFFSKT